MSNGRPLDPTAKAGGDRSFLRAAVQVRKTALGGLRRTQVSGATLVPELDSTRNLPGPQRVPQRIDAEVGGRGLSAKRA